MVSSCPQMRTGVGDPRRLATPVRTRNDGCGREARAVSARAAGAARQGRLRLGLTLCYAAAPPAGRAGRSDGSPRVRSSMVGRALSILMLAAGVWVVAGCGEASAPAPKGRIVAVGAENEYANGISQIGGRYVAVTAIESNPNTDPHTFEASPSVAEVVSEAALVVQNGVGYDT